VVATLNDTGTLLNETRYLPFGGVRDAVGTITETDFGYTGQRDLPKIGWMDYHARFYGDGLGRFAQADTITQSLLPQ
jgi:RHS repeat-associated protein